MAENLQNTRELKSLLILHKAMLMGILIFTTIAFGLVYSGGFSADMKKEEKIFQVIAVILSVSGFYIGSYLFKSRLKEIKESHQSLQEKMVVYRSASIVQWALIEGPAMFTIICFMLTGNYAFLLLDIVLLVVFSMLTPSKIKIVFQLQLSQQEADDL